MAFDGIETPFGKVDKIVGGAATYIGLCASYFTDNIGLVSVLGNDFDMGYLQLLQDKGIDIEGVEIKPAGKTFFWKGKYHNDLNTRDTLVTELNVLGEFDPKLPDSYKNADFVMLGNLSPGVQSSVIRQMAKKPKLIAMDTMNFWMDIAMGDLKETISLVDVLIINEEEARQLSGEYSLVKAARIIQGMGPRFLIIKKGEHGALLFGERQVFFAPALPLEEVFDPTGAGDTFAGGFMGFLAKTKDISFENMKRAIIYGSAMASFCVEQFGTRRLENLTLAEIDHRIGKFVELVRFEV